MSYQEFINEIIHNLKCILPQDTDVKVHQVMKNNNLVLDGLTIMNPETNISPTFYLNYYYDDYKEHHDLNRIIDLILSTYRAQPDMKKIDVSFFTDFKEVKNNIVYKLINFSMNKHLLADVPHIPYLDLAIVFYYMVNHEGFENGSILIHNQHLNMWNITDRELYQLAIENTPKRLPYHLMTMGELLKDTEFPMDRAGDNSMYVLSNRSKIFGASTILYLNLLDEISEQLNSSFYILPSSVHEVILVPEHTPSQLKYYSNMVHEVNTNHVLDEELLSDHAYFYNREEKAIIYY